MLDNHVETICRDSMGGVEIERCFMTSCATSRSLIPLATWWACINHREGTPGSFAFGGTPTNLDLVLSGCIEIFDPLASVQLYCEGSRSGGNLGIGNFYVRDQLEQRSDLPTS